jgi:hypothetical protein
VCEETVSEPHSRMREDGFADEECRPTCSGTLVNQSIREWVPRSFDDFLEELQHLEGQFNTEDQLLIFRGHCK